MTLTKESALNLFNTFTEKDWPVSIKHVAGKYAIEIPTALRGTPAYKREREVVRAFHGLSVKIEQTNVGTMRIS